MRSGPAALIILLLLLPGCQAGTRPVLKDSDADALPDILELEGWNITVRTASTPCFDSQPASPANETRYVRSNELRTDTDADGVTDYDEYLLQSDPTRNDTDGDGLTDGEEFRLRSDESLFAGFLLKLNDVDSDEDCLGDAEEVRGFVLEPFGLRTTDPTTIDSDHDGLTDPQEVHEARTDPRDADTDDDGATDRLDADPLRDLWLRYVFDRLLLKRCATPDADAVDVVLYATAPGYRQPEGLPPRFNVRIGESTPVPANNSPGLFDFDDRLGSSIAFLEFYGYRLDGQGRPIAILPLNPYEPDQPVQVRLDVVAGTWSFRDPSASGGYTNPGTQTSLESPDMRIEFTFELRDPPAD